MDPHSDTVPTKNIDLYIAMTRFLPVATISLFILCTAHLALLLAGTTVLDQMDETSVVGAGDPSYLVFQLNFATNVIYVTNNVIADSIFIFRCHAIWNFDDRIVFLPILLTFGVGGLGYFDSGRSIVVSRPLFNLSIATSVFTTFMLISLSAGRIWWLARKARDVLGQKITTRYNTACAMMSLLTHVGSLESGVLYCIGGIVYIILSMGIAPTIIAVRVGLGKSIESVDSFIVTEQQRVAPRKIQNDVVLVHSIQDQILYLRPENDRDAEEVEVV
ncbi:hypothetical protein DFH09DRAFT_1432977 [Mycena vulgaris]|nr:hypothetical protein DFH09DRAFT_1432977 [Mycena vulgaris]